MVDDIVMRLRLLAEQDGCQTSLQAADYIEKLQRQLKGHKDYLVHIRFKIGKLRHQRAELRRQLAEKTDA
jgi:hypothetical protein